MFNVSLCSVCLYVWLWLSASVITNSEVSIYFWWSFFVHLYPVEEKHHSWCCHSAPLLKNIKALISFFFFRIPFAVLYFLVPVFNKFICWLFYLYGSVHRWSILIIVQRDATQSCLLFCKFTICFGCQPHPSSGVHKTLNTASGTGHIFCVATSLQRGLTT
jgi:hypothetical protein